MSPSLQTPFFKHAMRALAITRRLFWSRLLSASAHTLQQSEGTVDVIQSHIWTFCKTSILHGPRLTRGRNKRMQTVWTFPVQFGPDIKAPI